MTICNNTRREARCEPHSLFLTDLRDYLRDTCAMKLPTWSKFYPETKKTGLPVFFVLLVILQKNCPAMLVPLRELDFSVRYVLEHVQTVVFIHDIV